MFADAQALAGGLESASLAARAGYPQPGSQAHFERRAEAFQEERDVLFRPLRIAPRIILPRGPFRVTKNRGGAGVDQTPAAASLNDWLLGIARL